MNDFCLFYPIPINIQPDISYKKIDSYKKGNLIFYYYELENSSLTINQRITKVFQIALNGFLYLIGKIELNHLNSLSREVYYNKLEKKISCQEEYSALFKETLKRSELLEIANFFYGFALRQEEYSLGIFNYSKLDTDIDIEKDPFELAYTTAFQELNLASNGLTKLPTWINKLKDLKKLNLSFNELEDFSELSNFSGLENLDLSGNELGLFPTSLNNLSRLYTLNLSFNKLTELPLLNDLAQLQTLILRSNKFVAFPEVKGLANLKMLDLSFNSLTIIPSEIFDLPQECTIDLTFNELDEKTIELIEKTINDENYQGPKICYD